MRFQYTPYFAYLSVTAIISATLTIAIWRRRSTPARTSFALMMMAVTGYATVAALEAAAIALPDKVFWSKLEYVGSGSVITFFLMFAFYFTGQRHWLQIKHTALLWIVPIFNMVLVATNEWHGLVWTGFLSGPQGSNLIIYQHGSGFFWVMVCVYAYVVTGSLLLLKASVRPSPLYRRQSGTVLLGSLIPLIGSSLYMLNLTPPGLNITPMSFMLTGLVFSASLFRFRMFDLIPVARDMLVERMSDGVLVLDQKNRIVDINPAAQRLFGVTAGCVGKSVDEVLARWSDIFRCRNSEDFKLETVIDGEGQRHVEIQISLLRDAYYGKSEALHRGRTGYLVILHDITQRHQIEVELRLTNEHLQNQLLEIELLHLKLQEQAIRDKLTGLLNRHYFEQTLPKELARAGRLADSVVIIILDIDYFKKINDTFGHQAGDCMLRAFGHLLGSQIRTSDMACRFGGEEFVLVLPGISLDDAYLRAEQIRLSFQALRVEWEETEIYTTVSGGIAVFPLDGETEIELIQVADRALYAAKAAGRNCIKLGGLSGGLEKCFNATREEAQSESIK